MIPLLDEPSRQKLVSQILKKFHLHKGLSESDFRYIASKTKGYTTTDIGALCKEASAISIQKSVIEDGQLTLNVIRPLTRFDFDEALRIIKPSIPQLQQPLTNIRR